MHASERKSSGDGMRATSKDSVGLCGQDLHSRPLALLGRLSDLQSATSVRSDAVHRRIKAFSFLFVNRSFSVVSNRDCPMIEKLPSTAIASVHRLFSEIKERIERWQS